MVSLAAVGIMLAPLFDSTRCVVEEWKDHPYTKDSLSPRSFVTESRNRFGVPRVAGHFGHLCVVAVLLAVLLDPQGQFDADVALHHLEMRPGP